jgi:hypothetical protein
MLLFESHVRVLLVLHAVSAGVLVGASTHQLLWCRHYLKGNHKRKQQERLFAIVSACAFVSTLLLGNLLYPTYKVRVRAEYLDSPRAVAAEADLRRDEASRLAAAPLRAERGAPDLGWVARLFDVKEHWVALGCAASLVLLLLSRRAHPTDERRLLVAYLGLSLFVCGTAWTGAIIGLVTASFRSVGGAS